MMSRYRLVCPQLCVCCHGDIRRGLEVSCDDAHELLLLEKLVHVWLKCDDNTQTKVECCNSMRHLSANVQRVCLFV